MKQININTTNIVSAVISVKNIILAAEYDGDWEMFNLWSDFSVNVPKVEELFIDRISRMFLGNENMIKAAKEVLAAGAWTDDSRWGCNFLLPATKDVLANIRA